MPELRRDPTTGAWTILAVERAARPGGGPTERTQLGEAKPVAGCPFCLGHEHETPPEILRLPSGARPWSVRVVPNKYPALTPTAADPREVTGVLMERRPARGHHEVIVEGPLHRPQAAPPDPGVLRDVLLAARGRYRSFLGDPALRHFALFKNHGAGGGASLSHPHWQLVASPLVPPALERALRIAAAYRQATGRALMDDLIAGERAAAERVVEVTEDFAVLAAFAPQWDGETWIVPRLPGQTVGGIDDRLTAAFAEVLWRTLRRVARMLGEPPLNVVIHSAPLGGDAAASFRWHARIQPRLGTRAGFELGSGIALVTLAPETTAEDLRRNDEPKPPSPGRPPATHVG